MRKAHRPRFADRNFINYSHPLPLPLPHTEVG